MRKVFYYSIIMMLTLHQSSLASVTYNINNSNDVLFNLDWTLEHFKNASNPSDFEERINKDNQLSNLDLNQDGYVDFIKVNSYKDGDIRIFVLQVDLNEYESQDIATIFLERTGDKSAVIQIIGDPDIFGEEKIIEPYVENPSFGGKGSSQESEISSTLNINVWTWSGVRFSYSPTFKTVRSKWTLHHRPSWYKAKRIQDRVHFVKANKRPVTNFRIYHSHRITNARHVYMPMRKSCVKNSRKVVKGKKHSRKHRK